jgi:hypothetical protein
MLVSVLGVSRAFSGPVVSTNENLIPGRYQGMRVDGVQGGMCVVDTASAKVKCCGITPVGGSPWNN